jgi:DNA anti-recombination protein RmuC
MGADGTWGAFHAPEVMMTPEEMDRKIEFILQMQARFEGNLEKMRLESSAADERLRESQATLAAAMIRITELMEQAQRQTDERFKRLDERLNALITVVEKHITGPDHGARAH